MNTTLEKNPAVISPTPCVGGRVFAPITPTAHPNTRFDGRILDDPDNGRDNLYCATRLLENGHALRLIIDLCPEKRIRVRMARLSAGTNGVSRVRAIVTMEHQSTRLTSDALQRRELALEFKAWRLMLSNQEWISWCRTRGSRENAPTVERIQTGSHNRRYQRTSPKRSVRQPEKFI